MPKPTCLKDLQTFLGMVQYLSKFSPKIAEIVEPLYDLTKKHAPYVWGPEQSQAFDDIKKEIVQAPILEYYDPKISLETILAKSLTEAMPWLQWLLICTFPYDFRVWYIKGSTNQLADWLSWLGCQKDKIQLPKLKVHASTKQLPVTADILNQFHTETAHDKELSLLKHIVKHGWSQNICEVPKEIQPY